VTIRLLYPVADERAGAVLDIDEGRAARLIRTGYAEAVALPALPRRGRERTKE